MYHQLQYYRMLLVAHRVCVLSRYKAVILQSIIKQSIFVMGNPCVFVNWELTFLSGIYMKFSLQRTKCYPINCPSFHMLRAYKM
jgi:hypothetical protein